MEYFSLIFFFVIGSEVFCLFVHLLRKEHQKPFNFSQSFPFILSNPFVFCSKRAAWCFLLFAELWGWDAVESCWWSISWLIDPRSKPADIWLMKQLGSVPAASPPAINILEALEQAERQQHPRAVWYRLSIMHYSSICEGAVRGAEIWWGGRKCSRNVVHCSLECIKNAKHEFRACRS